tara:strand:- start:3184 stop:3348 length:165 start_codon:yes stop_codon:yes gene_type:complete
MILLKLISVIAAILFVIIMIKELFWEIFIAMFLIGWGLLIISGFTFIIQWAKTV